MTDYKDLIDRLRSMYGHGDIQFNELINRRTGPKAADAMAALVVRVAELEAERAEREKQKPVTTVENRYNADGKSCHITDDLPAGMPLYAAQPVAAPVRLTDEQAEKVDEAIREALGDAYDCLRVWNAWSYGTMGPDDFSQVAEDSDRVAEIRNAAAVALGFKLEGEQ